MKFSISLSPKIINKYTVIPITVNTKKIKEHNFFSVSYTNIVFQFH